MAYKSMTEKHLYWTVILILLKEKSLKFISNEIVSIGLELFYSILILSGLPSDIILSLGSFLIIIHKQGYASVDVIVYWASTMKIPKPIKH